MFCCHPHSPHRPPKAKDVDNIPKTGADRMPPPEAFAIFQLRMHNPATPCTPNCSICQLSWLRRSFRLAVKQTQRLESIIHSKGDLLGSLFWHNRGFCIRRTLGLLEGAEPPPLPCHHPRCKYNLGLLRLWSSSSPVPGVLMGYDHPQAASSSATTTPGTVLRVPKDKTETHKHNFYYPRTSLSPFL